MNPPPQHDIDVPNAEIFIKSKPSPRWGPQSKRRCVILNLSSPDLFILFKTYVIIGLFNISGQPQPQFGIPDQANHAGQCIKTIHHKEKQGTQAHGSKNLCQCQICL